MDLISGDLLTGHEIVLSKVKHTDIETIRIWRNSPEVSQFMEFRGEISPEMQEKWFAQIDNVPDQKFFLIQIDRIGIGLINVKNIDYSQKTGEAGIFIAQSEYLNGLYSFAAMIMLYDFCFNDLSLETLYAHVLKSNKRAIRYNKFFGYQLQPGQENISNQLYHLSRNDYFLNRSKIVATF